MFAYCYVNPTATCLQIVMLTPDHYKTRLNEYFNDQQHWFSNNISNFSSSKVNVFQALAKSRLVSRSQLPYLVLGTTRIDKYYVTTNSLWSFQCTYQRTPTKNMSKT